MDSIFIKREPEMEKTSRKLAGWMMIGLIVVGILGILAAVLAMLSDRNYLGAGLSLLAAAYAFSSVLKAYR
jgi:hypothetical protein